MAKEKLASQVMAKQNVDVNALLAELEQMKAVAAKLEEEKKELAQKLASKPGAKEMPKWKNLDIRDLVRAVAVLDKNLSMTAVNVLVVRHLGIDASPNWISQSIPDARKAPNEKGYKPAPTLNDEQRAAVMEAMAKLSSNAPSNPDKTI